MNILNKLSLKAKLIGVVLFAIVSLVAVSMFSMSQMNAAYVKEVKDHFESMSNTLGLKISAQFFERYGDVQAFAINESIESLDGKLMQSDLDSYATLYAIYDLILVVDRQGRYVGSNQKDVYGKPINQRELSQTSFAEAPWFKAAMEGKFTNDPERGFSGTFVEDPHVDPLMLLATGEKRATTGFTAVIKNPKNEVIGVVTNRANSKWIDGEIVETFQKLKSSGAVSSMITILNKEGMVLADYRPAESKSEEMRYDFDKMFLKASIADLHGAVAPVILEGKSGVMESVDQIDKEVDIVGFGTIDNAKWPKSLGWRVLVHDSKEELMMRADTAEAKFFWFTGISSFVILVVSVFFGLVLSKTIAAITVVLAKNSSEVSDAASKIASSSTQLSEAATEQAAALQQTVAAVDEISAMVDKNAESASRSKEASAQSRDAALRGRQIVDDMIQAISEINESNNEVSHQMDHSNTQLSEITRLINDIGSKTKVINEIVFQTKLLSFNASVEAARAGEYGKGFAVVAEEVGNLAQMSGNAAKEITTLLEESVSKVEGIVNESKVKVERLMNSSREKVRAGSETANSCNKALDEILTSVSSVDGLVSEIAVASEEQATGIREIAKAVGQMEQVTQQNSSVAESTSVAAEQLNGQSLELRSVVTDLSNVVAGQGGSSSLLNDETHEPKADRQGPSVGRSARDLNRNAQVLKFKPKSSTPVESRQSAPALARVAGGDAMPNSDHSGFEE